MRSEEFERAHERLLGLSGRLHPHKLLQLAVDDAEALTSSRIGFFHTVDEHGLTLQAWSSRTLDGICKAAGAGGHYPIDRAGIWADAIRQAAPVIHNDYAGAHGRKGLPPGHVTVTRELVVPVIRNGEVRAVLGVGNKETPYDESDIAVMEQLASDMWGVIEYSDARAALETRILNDRALASSALDLTHTRTHDDVFDVATSFFAQVLPNAIIVMNALHAESGELEPVRVIGATPRLFEQGAAILGREIMHRRFPLSAACARAIEQPGLLRVEDGVLGLTDGQIQKGIARALETLLGTSAVHLLAISADMGVVGVMMILSRTSTPKIPKRVLEAFAHSCFLALARVNADAAVRAEAQANSMLIENMAEGLALYETVPADGDHADYRFIKVNEAFAALYGHPVAAIEGHLYSELFSPSELDTMGLSPAAADLTEPIRIETFDEPRGRHLAVTTYPTAANRFATLTTDITERVEAEQVLRHSERLLRETLGGIRLMGLIVNTDATVAYCNDFLLELIGRSREEALGLGWFDTFVPAEVATQARAVFDASVARGSRTHHFNGEVISASGEVRLIAWNSTLLLDHTGAKLGVAFIGEDVTDVAAAQEALRQSEEKYSVAFMTSPDAVNITRVEDATYVDVNEGFLRLTGFDRSEVIGVSALALNIWADPQDRAQVVQRLREDGFVSNYEAEFCRKDGSRLTALMSARPIVIDGEPCLLTVTRDITARKEAERQVHLYAERLSSMAEELTRTENRERRRLAEELHDRVSQTLAVAKMHLDGISSDPQEAKDVAVVVSDLLAQAISESRAITSELAPPVLYELGLPPALAWLCESMETRSGIAIHCDLADTECELDDEVKEALFRAARELLVNVVKHANADQARLTIRRDGDTLELRVTDDGIGCTETVSPKGFGLFSVRERVSWLGGTLSVEPAPNGGTSARVLIPCRSSERE